MNKLSDAQVKELARKLITNADTAKDQIAYPGKDESTLLNDEDLPLDDLSLGDLEFAGEVPIPVISSFEDLLHAINTHPDQRPDVYEIRTRDSQAEIESSDKRLLLDYLPVYVASLDTPLEHSDAGLRSLRYLGEKLGYSSRHITEMTVHLKDIDLLHSGRLISFECGIFTTPYGSIKSASEYEFQLNPLILSAVCDAYRDQTIFDRRDICKVVENNMSRHFMPDGEGDFWSVEGKSHQIIFAHDDDLLKSMPASKSPEHAKILKEAKACHTALHRVFFHTVLPIVFMDDRFKSYVCCSLLTDEDLENFICRRLYLAFLYFICSCEQISKVANSKLRDIAGLDAKAVFARKNPVAAPPLRRIPTNKDSVEVTLAVDAERRETVELTGLVVSAKAFQAFSDLCGKHPHFYPVFDYLLPFVEASFVNSTPLVFPPILIAGPPGIGKTKFISELFGVFEYPINHCHSSQFTCGSGLVGLQSTWGTAQPGYVSQAIRRSQRYNPLIAFDELERVRMASYGGNGVSVEAAFMRLLEPLEASRFVDSCGNHEVDVSKVNWIFTCNDPSLIPGALLTRLEKVCVYPPIDEAVIDKIHRDIWCDLVGQYAGNSRVNPWISEDAIDHLREVYYTSLNFRASIKVFKLALSKLLAGAMGASYLTLDVIESKAKAPSSYN